MRLWKIAQRKPPQRPAPSPIVLRFQVDAKLLEARSEGYRLRAAVPEKLTLRVRVFNLSDRAHGLVLRAAFSQAETRAAGPAERKVSVPAGAFAEAAWDVDARGAFASTGQLGLTVTAAGATAGPILPLHVDLSGNSGQPEKKK